MPTKRSPKLGPEIEAQETLAETGRRSYEMVRLSRIRYADNPLTFIDLRLFQRGWDEEGEKEIRSGRAKLDSLIGDTA